jgi:acetyl esterase/lipase
VFNVEYRLAPEVKAPEMMGDMVSVIEYIHSNANNFGVDKKKIALWGGSGGGFVVAATGIMLVQQNKSGLVKLIICEQPVLGSYWLTDEISKMPIHEQVGNYDSPILARWISKEGDEKKALKAKDPLVFPNLASDEMLKKYPPTVLIEAEFDLYNTIGARFAERLKTNGRLLEFGSYPGGLHTFWFSAEFEGTKLYEKHQAEIIAKYLKAD